jgi:hypothetical protein
MKLSSKLSKQGHQKEDDDLDSRGGAVTALPFNVANLRVSDEREGQDSEDDGITADSDGGEEYDDSAEDGEALSQLPAAKRKRKHEASIPAPKRKRTNLDLPSRPGSSHPVRRVSFAAGVRGGKGKNADATSPSISDQKQPGVPKDTSTRAAASKAKLSTLAKERTTRTVAPPVSIASSKQTKSSGDVGGEAYDFKQFF